MTRSLVFLLRLDIGLLVVAICLNAYSWFGFSRMPLDVNADDTFLASDLPNFFVGVCQIGLGIILAITFLRWIYCTNKNLQAVAPRPMRFSPGWSIGWFFVPFLNLIKPYQALSEIWQVAHRGTEQSLLIVRWWWGTWILANLLGRSLVVLTFYADDAQSYAMSTIAYLVSDGLDLASAIASLILVERIATAFSANYVKSVASAGGSDQFNSGGSEFVPN